MVQRIQSTQNTQGTVNMLLDVRHLSVDYNAFSGTVHAVNDVSISLRRGEILGLAGESGSGKSTLAYAIARLLRPPAVIIGGEVLYYPSAAHDNDYQTVRKSSLKNGQNELAQQNGHTTAEEEGLDILQLSPSQLRAFRWNELSIVFQSAMNALNPVLSVGDQIIDVLKTHRPDMGTDARVQRAIELLHLVGIAPDRLRSYPHELSGGMRQRAIIAIALALRPELIIMDEPTTALDVVVQREILQLISELCKEFNTSLIFITHDLSLLLELADSIAIMYAGNIIERTTSRELYKNPRHPYSYGLLNSFPKLHGPRRKMSGIPGSPPDLRALPAGCAFHPRCPLAFAPCTTMVPSLQSLPFGHDGQQAACHLYDPRFRPQGAPTLSELAAHYEAMVQQAEGSRS
jgi:peptide/nickel transport system ATP-binding protein